MWICRLLSSVIVLLSPSTRPISITRHLLDLHNSPNWSHRQDLALRGPWDSLCLNLMSTQLSWRSWVAGLTSQSTLIESASNKTKVEYTQAYRTPMPLRALLKAVSGQEWKSLKREVVKRECQQTLKNFKTVSRQPVKARTTTPWFRSEMKMMCFLRRTNHLSSSKLAWRKKKLMSTKRCSLNKERLSTWPQVHNSFSNKANSTTNQRNTTSSNVKTSRNGAHCLNWCSRLRSSYPSMP